MKTVNILIIEDHKGIAQALQLVLAQYERINKTYLAHNYKETLDVLKQGSIDVVILDINLDSHEYDGFIIAQKIKQLYSRIKVIIYSDHVRKTHYERLFNECKVDAYLDKQSEIEEIYTAINKVLNNEIYVDKNVMGVLQVKDWMNLSAREKEVIALLSEGITQKEIADKLCVSPRTVESHLRTLFKKTQTKNAVELVKKYIQYKSGNRDANGNTPPPFMEL